MSRQKKPRQMVQWAPGTKMQRFDRTDDVAAFRENFEKAMRNRMRGAPKRLHFDIIKPGDLLLVQGRTERAGEVNYETKSVMVGIHKHAFNAVKRMPQWFDGAWSLLENSFDDVDFDFRAPVVDIVLEPHPNATKLSIIRVFGYTVVVQTEEFKDVKRGMWILPDSRILSNDPYYDWLGKEKRRVRVRKFRGIESFGIIVPVPDSFPVNGDAQAFKGICHYKSKDPRNTVNGNQ